MPKGPTPRTGSSDLAVTKREFHELCRQILTICGFDEWAIVQADRTSILKSLSPTGRLGQCLQSVSSVQQRYGDPDLPASDRIWLLTRRRSASELLTLTRHARTWRRCDPLLRDQPLMTDDAGAALANDHVHVSSMQCRDRTRRPKYAGANCERPAYCSGLDVNGDDPHQGGARGV